MLGWTLGLACLAFAVWGLTLPEQPKQPRRPPEPGPLGQAVGEAVAGAFGLAGAAVGLLVTLAPVLILLWLVTR